MSRLSNPYAQFLDDAGVPVSNGTITFYVNGDINTQKNIYSDRELTTTGSNPYTLDGYGRVTGNVWLDGLYTIILKDSDGATIRQIDDVEDLSSAAGSAAGETVQGDVNNKFINGACRVESDGGSITISGSYQESEVEAIYVKAQGTPTNGTADLVKTTSVGTSGYAMQVTDLTTGAGGTVDYRFRFNSVDSRDLVNAAAIFQCNVLQNTGASKTYTISVYKATAEDNFTSTSLISASSGTSVSDSADTKISFSVADMGDCSNGIEVIVSVACGAVTTKDFYINDIVFRKGQSEITFEQKPYNRDFVALKYGKRNGVLPRDALIDCKMSLDTDTDHDINVTAGYARDETNVIDINVTSEFTKQIDAVWAEGNDAGGFPSAGGSGLTLTANTWYYFFLIAKADGSYDGGWDSNANASVLLNADNAGGSSYVYYRAIGAVYVNASSNIEDFYYLPDLGKGQCRILLTANTTFPMPPDTDYLSQVTIVGAGGGGSQSGAASAGTDTVFGSYTAGGGAGGTDTAGYDGGIGGDPSFTWTMPSYVILARRGGYGESGGVTASYGGENGLIGFDYVNGGTTTNPRFGITGASTATGNGIYGGGGGGSSSQGGGGGGAAIVLRGYYQTGATVSVTVGAGGAGSGTAGDGGDGYVEILI